MSEQGKERTCEHCRHFEEPEYSERKGKCAITGWAEYTNSTICANFDDQDAEDDEGGGGDA